jgi:hypothetical protein
VSRTDAPPAMAYDRRMLGEEPAPTFLGRWLYWLLLSPLWERKGRWILQRIPFDLGPGVIVLMVLASTSALAVIAPQEAGFLSSPAMLLGCLPLLVAVVAFRLRQITVFDFRRQTIERHENGVVEPVPFQDVKHLSLSSEVRLRQRGGACRGASRSSSSRWSTSVEP